MKLLKIPVAAIDNMKTNYTGRKLLRACSKNPEFRRVNDHTWQHDTKRRSTHKMKPKNMFGSEQSFRNYNVSVQAMQVDWIINKDEGQLFLQNMIKCENPEMYENKSIIILIEWLFSKFKYNILLARLPLYVG